MMKKFIKILCAVLSGAILVSCEGNFDADAEIAALEAEMDRLEQEDQAIRAHFLERINTLRSRLTGLINEVEADLIARIDNEEAALIGGLNKKIMTFKSNMQKAFNDSRTYMNQSFKECRSHISYSFSNLDESRDALEVEITKAINQQQTAKVNKLLNLEKELNGVNSRAQTLEKKIRDVEKKLRDAEAFNQKLNNLTTVSHVLDDAYAEMEKNQLKLMKMVKNELTENYLNSLSTAQLNALKRCISKADGLLEDMQQFADEIADFATDSEDLLSSMESLADDFGSAVSDYESMVSDCEETMSNSNELWEYFVNSDAETYYNNIINITESNQNLYDNSIAQLDELMNHLRTYEGTVDDWHSEAHDYLQACYDYADTALEYYQEIESIRGW